MNTAKRIRRAQERPTWLPVEHRIGGALYKVYPSGTVYRMEGKTLRRIDGADADCVLRAVMANQQEASGHE